MGLARRKVLYPGHRHVAGRFYKPCANCHLSDYLARCAPLQRRPRSGRTSKTDVGFRIHMRVRCIDQNAAVPIDPFQRFTHVDPMYSENNDVALDRLLPGSRDGAWTKVSDKSSQCLRTSGVGHDHVMTSGDEMTAECTRYLTGTNKTYFHDQSLFCGWNCERARPLDRACPSGDCCNQPSLTGFRRSAKKLPDLIECLPGGSQRTREFASGILSGMAPGPVGLDQRMRRGRSQRHAWSEGAFCKLAQSRLPGQ
jgi:hypothetical protein